jgi:predicted transcriptional regulator
MYTTKAGERRFQIAAAVSEEVYEELRRIAYMQRTTVSAQVRQAVNEYVDRNPVVQRFTEPIERGQRPAEH